MNGLDWKDKLNMAFSDDQELKELQSTPPQEEVSPDGEKLSNNKQTLRIEIDRKGRKGKTATLISGYIGTDEDLAELAKLIKTKCGSGGSSRCGEILIQGDFKQKVNEILKAEGDRKSVV